MNGFREVGVEEWANALDRFSGASVFMRHHWEEALAGELPFISVRHYRYNESHLVRVAHIGGRCTTAPFSEGSDIVALHDAELDHVRFASDAASFFGNTPRLRINERFAPISNIEEDAVAAHEYVVDLTEPILPRVRKTVRHILARSIDGTIERTNKSTDIDAAYRLYLRHMRSVRNFAMPQALFVSLITKYGGELWVWRREAAPLAAALFIPDRAEVLYSLSAADSAAFESNAPHHLVYAALEEYRNRGLMRASLGATGKGSALEVFKRGWRGKQYRIVELGARAGVSRTSQTRELAGYVPLRFYPLLTSKVGKYLL